jgi:hypothetical protein
MFYITCAGGSGGEPPEDPPDDRWRIPYLVIHRTIPNLTGLTLLNSWINVLLAFAPLGIALNFVKSVDKRVVFVVIEFWDTIFLSVLVFYLGLLGCHQLVDSR